MRYLRSKRKRNSNRYIDWQGNIKGQTAVFLCIILLGVTALAGVLTDISRISTGKVYVGRAASAAAKSILAGYSSKLCNNYGVFAYNAADISKLEKAVKEYMNGNLSGEKRGDGFDLYDFRVDKVDVTPMFNLTENEATRQQILEYMKFRAPKALVEGILDRLDAVKQSGRMAGVYKRKMTLDKLLGKMGKSQEALKRNVSGTIGDGKLQEYYINGFDSGTLCQNLLSKLSWAAEEYSSGIERIEELNRLLEQINSLEDSKLKKNEIKKVQIEINDLRVNLSDIREQIDDTMSSVSDASERYLGPNRKARENIAEIIEYGKKAGAALKLLEDFVEQPQSGAVSISGEFDTTIGADIKKVRELLFSGGKAEELLSVIDGNIVSLESAGKAADSAARLVKSGSISVTAMSQAAASIQSSLSAYSSSIGYDYATAAQGTGGPDNREESARQARSLIDILPGEDISFEKAGIDAGLLPSRLKRITGDMDGNGTAKQATVQDSGIDNAGMVTGDKIDLVNQENLFAENAFGFLDKIGSIISEKLSTIRDEVYINEYIMGTFKSAVTKMKNGSGEESVLDLRGSALDAGNTFFNSEVEYILNGNSSEKINKTIIKTEILLIRFGLNTFHVYSDQSKRELSDGIAVAASGWWSAGAAVPILSNLIRCGWGLGEAILDIGDLMQGKSVPFLKGKGDWRLDIGISAKGGGKSDPRLSFSYHDYLRLFLFLENPETKISRIEDLVQLNLQKKDPAFEMGNFSTYIKIEAEVSMKYLFVTGGFMPKNLKTKDGRHKFKLVLYEGY